MSKSVAEMYYHEIADGWKNTISGIGSAKDKGSYNEVGDARLLHPQELTNVWMGEGLGKRIITSVADDMVLPGFTIKNDTDNDILDRMTELGFDAILNEATYWARLFGGALVVMDTSDDEDDLSDELPDSGFEVLGLRLFDATMVDIGQATKNVDPTDRHFGEPEIFVVQKEGGGGQFEVHRSRCLFFKGAPIPQNSYAFSDENTRFWGVSALQGIFEEIGRAGISNKAVADLLQELSIGKFKMGNLGEILMENDGTRLYNRMDAIALCKSTIHMVLLGNDEEFTRDTLNLAGVPDVMDKVMMVVSTVSGIPKVKLTGEQEGGLGNGDNPGMDTYYSRVEANRKQFLRTPINYLARAINVELAVIPEGDPIIVDFNPARKPSPDKVADTFLKFMQAAEIAIQNGILHPDEVRQAFKQDGLPSNITPSDDYDTAVGTPKEGDDA